MLHHVIRGGGPRTLLVLHGFLGSGRNLGALARAWTARDVALRLVLPDLLGHGRSPPLPDEPSLEAVAEAVLALADTLGLGSSPLNLVGHSLGGRVALQARLLAPERVARVVLLDIRPGPILGSDTARVARLLREAPDHAPTREAMRGALEASGLSRGLAEWLLMSGDSVEGRFEWRVDRAALERFHAQMVRSDLWPAVAAGPTACIRAGLSDHVGADDVARFRELGAAVHTVEGAGHFLHVDRPEAVADLLAAES